MNIFVGNLQFQTTEEQLQDLFSQYGSIDSVKVITDRETGRAKGFAFVEMPDADQAQAAIEALNNFNFNGRNIVVNEARPKPSNGGNFRSGGEGNFRNRRY